MNKRTTANKVVLDGDVASNIFGVLVDLLSSDEALIVLEGGGDVTADEAVHSAVDALAALQSALMA